MHRLETRYDLVFDNRNRPLEGNYARDSWGAWQIHLATEFLRFRNWTELDKIGKVCLKPCEQPWYIGKQRRGELYQIATLPVVDEEPSEGDWLAIIIAARRTGLPFRAYAKVGSWQDWREYDIRYRRQATAGLQEGRGHQQGACDSPGASARSGAETSPGLIGCPSDSGFSGDHNPERYAGGDHQAGLASEMASVEGWGTRGSAISKRYAP